MRIKPEEVLEQNRIAAVSRIKESEVEHALKAGEEKREGDNRRAENHDQASGIVRPDEQRQTERRHARRAHRTHGYQEDEAGQDRREAVDEDADDGRRPGG